MISVAFSSHLPGRLQSTTLRFTTRRRDSAQRRYLNRFLFDPDEIDDDDDDSLKRDVKTVTLPKDDYRTVHAAKILGLHNGDTIRAGLISCKTHNGKLTDDATIKWIPEGKVKKAEPLGNGQPPGSLRIQLQNLQELPQTEEPAVALLLALPRPLQLGRMLPMIAQMGVSHLILTQAKKVPKDYFGSHLFRKPHVLRERLIEGLCQAGDVRLPEITVVKNLKNFLEHDLDNLFPSKDYARVVAHPQRADDMISPKRMRQIDFPSNDEKRILLAVGPEGGWEEPNELNRFEQFDFQQITLGNRILRSDCAVVSLLALADDACHSD